MVSESNEKVPCLFVVGAKHCCNHMKPYCNAECLKQWYFDDWNSIPSTKDMTPTLSQRTDTGLTCHCAGHRSGMQQLTILIVWDDMTIKCYRVSTTNHSAVILIEV